MSAANLKPEAGLLLVADRGLLDPNFARSVVLLAEHNDEGSMGFVLTRKTGVKIAEVAEEFQSDERREPLWIGGPVQSDSLWAIHRRADLAKISRPVGSGVWYGGQPSLVRSLLDMPAADEDGSILRLFAGYAGWEAGQLQAEIDQGAWAVVPALPNMFFGAGSDEIWPELLLRSKLPPRRNANWIYRAAWS